MPGNRGSRELLEDYLEGLPLAPEGGELAVAMRYVLQSGGKRVRPLLCLATGKAAGAEPSELLPAAAAIELVHTFSLVHDDLPALDDDALRRGRPSAHVEFGEAVAILTGDALLAEAFRLACLYDAPEVARELAEATSAMIGGQYLDVTSSQGGVLALNRLKTGRLFSASIGCALWVARIPEARQSPWRALAEEIGLLFQLVDDIMDGDGYVVEAGEEEARRLADEAAARARTRLADLPVDTSELAEIVEGLPTRAS